MNKEQISPENFKQILLNVYKRGYEEDIKLSILMEEIKSQLITILPKKKE